MIDYSSFCIDGTSIQILSGITLAMSTVNIMIFLFDLYIKYEIMISNVEGNKKLIQFEDDNHSSFEEVDYESEDEEDHNDVSKVEADADSDSDAEDEAELQEEVELQ
jgi:hypothetical protein